MQDLVYSRSKAGIENRTVMLVRSGLSIVASIVISLIYTWAPMWPQSVARLQSSNFLVAAFFLVCCGIYYVSIGEFVWYRFFRQLSFFLGYMFLDGTLRFSTERRGSFNSLGDYLYGPAAYIFFNFPTIVGFSVLLLLVQIMPMSRLQRCRKEKRPADVSRGQ
jgi:hypothetical protein